MSDVLEIIGGLTVAAIGIGVSILALTIAGNIYGGIKGAYRIRAISARAGKPRMPHTKTIMLGLKAWLGQRYRNGTGTYWEVGLMRVPIDGRDKIERG
ncbi:hypothetical protein HUV48_14135 [Altererythrobacter sp. HHU K3-1]|uniref:Uncharacterized protein n=2 Tax=Qipengyuania atrilutea TaxID=2744473 RepID=A0A850H8H8_9SPHN|nr:hypothetical protein [Actirhodobacter atriluteus]